MAVLGQVCSKDLKAMLRPDGSGGGGGGGGGAGVGETVPVPLAVSRRPATVHVFSAE